MAERKRKTAARSSSNSEQPKQEQSVEAYVRQKLSDVNADADTQQETPDLARIRKQFKRKNAKIPSGAETSRFTPDLNRGLEPAQVNQRFTQFLFNDTNQKFSKSYASIFIGNIFTFFNLLCVLAAAALVY